MQKAYNDFLFKKIIRLYAIIPNDFKLISTNELIKDTKLISSFILRTYKNPDISMMIIVNKEI